MTHNINADLLRQVAEILADTGFASLNMLQRRLGIGYATAAEAMVELERRGVVSPATGQPPTRTVLIRDPDELDAALEDAR